MRSSLRRQLLHLATDLSALAANPDDLGHGFDLLTRSYATPALQQIDRGLQALRDGAGADAFLLLGLLLGRFLGGHDVDLPAS